jgi:4-hydroxy-tetrahydrodipicolinate synthase
MAPLVTPFTSSFAIDWPAFDEHVSRLLAEGIEILIPADLVGEAWALDGEEKVQLFERTVRLSGGRAIVLAKISEPSLPGAARLAREAASVGVDAVKVWLPADPGGHEAIDAYVNAVGPDSGLPFLLETSGSDVPIELIDRLAEHPGLAGIEEPSLDVDRFDMLVQRYGARIPIIAGSEDVLGFTLLLGASGFMTASPNFAPAFMRSLWSAAVSGEAATTIDLYRRLRRYRRLFAAELSAGRPLFVSYTKAALDLLGHPVGPPRPPLRRLSDEDSRALAVTLRDALGLDVPHSDRVRPYPNVKPT